MRGYAPSIRQWAKQYGVDRSVMAAVFWKQSFAPAKAKNSDPATFTGPNGGVGIGQINTAHVGQRTPWGHLITQADLINPAFNIQWSTWFYSQQYAVTDNYDQAYARYVNNGGQAAAGASISPSLPKGYVPQGGLNPDQKAAASAAQSVATKNANRLLTDPWVTVDRNGHVQYVQSETPPKNVVKYGPTPLTASGFNSVWKQTYQDTFFAYTGREATGAEVRSILGDAPSVYTLATRLAGSKDFTQSPTYKAKAPGIAAYVKDQLGRAPNAAKIGQILSENWDPATVDAWIKKQPGYMKGPSYQSAIASLTPVYEQIMGTADEHGQAYIHDAAMNGWTQDTLANALRHDPAYKYSPEYEAKSVNFLDAMGLFVGARPVLKMDQAADAQPQPGLPLHLQTGDQLSNPLPDDATFRTPQGTTGTSVLPKPKSKAAPKTAAAPGKKPLL